MFVLPPVGQGDRRPNNQKCIEITIFPLSTNYKVFLKWDFPNSNPDNGSMIPLKQNIINLPFISGH